MISDSDRREVSRSCVTEARRALDRAIWALAEELEEETGSVCGVCMGKTARRIREACGEVGE